MDIWAILRFGIEMDKQSHLGVISDGMEPSRYINIPTDNRLAVTCQSSGAGWLY